ncbi:hypothetical protein AB0A71_17840 [Kitasatospora aureofaciens]|uniref:hypothetical protein n=1 Tax=Kitasatospora aureofaciens TaxID=1894 RepID=UPI0033F6C83A
MPIARRAARPFRTHSLRRFVSLDEPAAAIDTFASAYDEHDAGPNRWTYDGSPLEAA